MLGILVDAVQEVIDINQDQIAPAPRFGAQVDTQFMTGIARTNDNFVVILDLLQIFNHTEDIPVVTEAAVLA